LESVKIQSDLTTTRRDLLSTALTAAGVAETLLMAKGLVVRAALDAMIDVYEHKVGPRNGARVVARAWVSHK
jgi:nitrile hydratase